MRGMAVIKQALLSVSDKTGIVEFARGLAGAGVALLSTGAGDAIVTRYVVGPWEEYLFVQASGANPNGYYSIRTMSNGKFLCSATSTAAFRGDCTSDTGTSARFVKVDIGGGQFRLRSVVNNNYLSIASNGRLYSDATTTGNAATFMLLTKGKSGT